MSFVPNPMLEGVDRHRLRLEQVVKRAKELFKPSCDFLPVGEPLRVGRFEISSAERLRFFDGQFGIDRYKGVMLLGRGEGKNPSKESGWVYAIAPCFALIAPDFFVPTYKVIFADFSTKAGETSLSAVMVNFSGNVLDEDPITEAVRFEQE
jgi:hypothetical protein